MRVGADLEQEQKGQHTKSDCQWLGKSAQEWMRYSQNFLCLLSRIAFRVEPVPRMEQGTLQFN
jgi:hypothetical protein